jgi:hypothetical protein
MQSPTKTETLHYVDVYLRPLGLSLQPILVQGFEDGHQRTDNADENRDGNDSHLPEG